MKEILDSVLLPFIETLANAVFQQDNARPHVAVHSRAFLQRHRIGNRVPLPWPARSPDLNPIKHVWDSMGRHLRSLPCLECHTSGGNRSPHSKYASPSRSVYSPQRDIDARSSGKNVKRQ